MKTFEQFDLIEPLRQALADAKYQTPTPIQAQTVPAALDKRDVLGCAQTGTGKTAAFALPILNRLGKRNRKATPHCPFALVLAPTRELAIQIRASFSTYGRHLRFRSALVYGGVSQTQQVRAMERGAHVLIATPGRLLDLMNQGHIDLSRLEVFVLDEADRMLDMGFLPDLKRIIRHLPDERQSLFFSATMPPSIIQLSQRLLSRPVSVTLTPKATCVKSIQQRVLFVERNEKQRLLQSILTSDDVKRAIVFTRTKRAARAVSERLLRCGIKSTAIHGDKSQSARERALEAFRNNQVQVLVATDVAARGIDIDAVTHVINFDLPVEPEGYVHRIGRTGRAGAGGIALSLCTSADCDELRAIERFIGDKVPVDPDHPKSQQFLAERPSGKPRGKKRPRRSSGPKTSAKRSTTKRAKKSGGAKRPVRPAQASPEGSGPAKKKRRRRRPRPVVA